MRLDEFRRLVMSEFGDGLKNATPANVRDFLDRVGTDSGRIPERIVLDERCNSYEEVITDWFAQVLDLPPEEAVVALWTLALELAFASIESQYADKFAILFRELD